jgi:hypothetical protein
VPHGVWLNGSVRVLKDICSWDSEVWNTAAGISEISASDITGFSATHMLVLKKCTE